MYTFCSCAQVENPAHCTSFCRKTSDRIASSTASQKKVRSQMERHLVIKTLRANIGTAQGCFDLSEVFLKGDVYEKYGSWLDAGSVDAFWFSAVGSSGAADRACESG
jgi:hypothetical protein